MILENSYIDKKTGQTIQRQIPKIKLDSVTLGVGEQVKVLIDSEIYKRQINFTDKVTGLPKSFIKGSVRVILNGSYFINGQVRQCNNEVAYAEISEGLMKSLEQFPYIAQEFVIQKRQIQTSTRSFYVVDAIPVNTGLPKTNPIRSAPRYAQNQYIDLTGRQPSYSPQPSVAQQQPPLINTQPFSVPVTPQPNIQTSSVAAVVSTDLVKGKEILKEMALPQYKAVVGPLAYDYNGFKAFLLKQPVFAGKQVDEKTIQILYGEWVVTWQNAQL